MVDEAWSTPFDLDARQWDEVASQLAMVDGCVPGTACARCSIPTSVPWSKEPSMCERSCPIGGAWCLDTGHLAIGGARPGFLRTDYADRVELVHLKDVDLSLAPAVLDHEMSLLDATRAGLFQRLGHGNVDVASVGRRSRAGLRRLVRARAGHDHRRRRCRLGQPGGRRKASIDYLRGAGRQAGRERGRASHRRTRVVRVGLIGTGRIGRMHAELLATAVPGAGLAAVSDVVTPLADELGHAYNVPAIHPTA